MSENPNYGALTEAVFYILLSLQKPIHGYGIMQLVKELSKGRLNLGAGTLYGAINTLLEKGWIAVANYEPDSRKKEYIITALGNLAIEEEMIRLQELLDNGQIILRGEHNDTQDN